MTASAADARVTTYVCSALSLSILLSRLAATTWSRRPLDRGFVLAVLSVVVEAVRIATTHLYLAYGTAADAALRGEGGGDDRGYYFNPSDTHLVAVGSICSLFSRVLLTVTLWLQVSLLLVFYTKITSGIGAVARTVRWAWLFWAASLVAVVLLTFLECRPFRLYYDIPAKGAQPPLCARAYAQLALQGACNTVLDLAVLFIAFPLVTLRKRSLSQHLSLWTLFALGAFCIVVTCVRMALIFQQGSSQTTRSLWAAVQALVSTFVANAPTVYGALRVAHRQGHLTHQRHDNDDINNESYQLSCRSSSSATAHHPHPKQHQGQRVSADLAEIQPYHHVRQQSEPEAFATAAVGGGAINSDFSWLKMDHMSTPLSSAPRHPGATVAAADMAAVHYHHPPPSAAMLQTRHHSHDEDVFGLSEQDQGLSHGRRSR